MEKLKFEEALARFWSRVPISAKSSLYTDLMSRWNAQCADDGSVIGKMDGEQAKTWFDAAARKILDQYVEEEEARIASWSQNVEGRARSEYDQEIEALASLMQKATKRLDEKLELVRLIASEKYDALDKLQID